MKVLVGSNESVEYLQRDDLIAIAFGEFVLRTGVISDRLKELDELRENMPRLVEENKHIKQLQEKVSSLTISRDELQQKLSSKIQPVEQYETKIDILNKEKEKLAKLNANLTSKIETLEGDIQSLQDKNQDLKGSLKNKDKSSQSDLQLKFIADKYGKYLSLRNLARVVNVFIENPDREWRQTEIAHHEGLLKTMATPTVLNHLYDAKEKGIVHCPRFPGTYRLDLPDFGGMGADMDVLVRYIVGDEIYDIALMQALKKESFKHH